MRVMQMLAFIAFIGVVSLAKADSWPDVFRIDCDKAENAIRLKFMLGHEDERQYDLANQNLINPWLLTDSTDQRHITETRSTERQCVLHGTKYVISVWPIPCNFDTQGMNGASMMVGASISRRGRKLVSQIFGTCEALAPVTQKVLFRPGRSAEIIQVPVDEFVK